MGMRGAAVGLILTGALVTGCTSTPPVVEGTSSPTSGAPTSGSDSPSATGASSTTTTPTTTTTTTAAPTPTASPAPALSPETLFTKSYDGRNLQQVREVGSTAAYQQYLATFDGDGLTISGRLLVPRGTGPFPAVVLAHGYADPAVYDNTSQMSRERDYLARQGYVVLLVDYRNHATSSKDPDADANLRLGYAVDVINAAKALQQDPRVRPDRIALMGRSMGGGVTYTALVAAPGLFKAGIAYAPVSSNSVDNFEKWTRPDRATTQRVVAALGEPAADPDAWAKASARTYFSRITEPVLIHQGTADLSCPIAWAQASVDALKAAGKSVEYFTYPGQPHVFTTGPWTTSIQRSVAFLQQHLA
jgi:dipeptidyl aminopeptidase/acylaminoacyl peptidase